MNVMNAEPEFLETPGPLGSSDPSTAELRSQEPELSQHADYQLLDLFRRNRDAAAFAVMVERHHGMIFGIAKRMLGCPHTAEDVVQATFLVLAKDSRKIRKSHSLVSWLYGVAFRISARTARQQAKTVSILEDIVMVAADPLEKLNEQYEQETVFEELQSLPENLRAPLVLRYLKGNSNLEVAKELNLSESAVEGRMKRGRKHLRLRLARKGVTFAFGVGVLNLVQREVAAQQLTHLVSNTLASCASSVGGEFATNGTVDTGVSDEAIRLAEEEILKMATTKLISIAVMASVVVGMMASGWAMTGVSPTDGHQENPFTQLHANAGTSGSSDLGLPTVSVDQPTQESAFGSRTESSPETTSIPETKSNDSAEQRRKNVGHYSVEALPENELRVYEQLKAKASFDYFEERFEDVVAELGAKHEIQVLLDTVAVVAAGHSEESLITRKIENIELANALKFVLDPMSLTAIVQDEVLLITSLDKAESTLTTRIYTIRPEWSLSIEEMQTAINENVIPESWESNGGQGTMTQIPNGLVVSARHEVHNHINKLLAQFDQLYRDN